VVLVLRWIIHGRAVGPDVEPRHDDGYDNGHDGQETRGRGDNRNLIQRWFSRDDVEEHTH
ncbi:hypothetical protein, partial [Escherichia coli]|uniref:hypothetical protein n=1 Tax=Escherichia coli TaxID=562 RepID=UPI0015B9B4C8